MRKLIASINMTLDGYCDHTAMLADDELHENVNNLFSGADVVLFGRKTYQLMEAAWPAFVKNPSGNKPMDDFAQLMEDIHKIVLTNTLTGVHWKNAVIARQGLTELVTDLKQKPGKNILAGGPSIIAALARLGLVDEYQLCIHPVILGKGQVLFKDIVNKIDLALQDVKRYGSGAVVLTYVPAVG